MSVMIRVQNVQKSFRIYSDKKHTLKERLIHFGRSHYIVHPVLKGVDLEVERGTTVALIGENGSGKSTLLKLMSGIIYPDLGTINMTGKVSSLLELGAGFHPDFSGRENIYNNASIFGLTRKQIDERYDQIVAFSELEEFIDNPVRTYSSGMYMRLAFSVAINVDADILLIDEILAVGDAHFQKKCMNMIRQLKRQGVTIILVTHDMGAVERISDYTVWLEDGVIRESGLSRKVIDMYLLDQERKNSPALPAAGSMGSAASAGPAPAQPADGGRTAEPGSAASAGEPETAAQARSATEEPAAPEVNPNRWGTGAIEIVRVSFLNAGQAETAYITCGEPLQIRMTYRIHTPCATVAFGLALNNMDGTACVATNTLIRQVDLGNLPETGTVHVDFESLRLTEGQYTLDVACHSEDGLPYDYQKNAGQISVYSATKDAGIYSPEQKWYVR